MFILASSRMNGLFMHLLKRNVVNHRSVQEEVLGIDVSPQLFCFRTKIIPNMKKCFVSKHRIC